MSIALAQDGWEGTAARALARADVPGLAAAAVSREGIVFARGVGWADREARIPAAESTLFLAASCSKLVVAAVVLALCDRRMLRLDEEVERYLPFSLRHPEHPAVPITLRMLLQHRAAIADDTERMRRSYVAGDSPVPLVDWIRLSLGIAHGARPTRGFADGAPGRERRYSNTGIAIAACAAERAARMPFEELARALVFRPLGMKRSTFRIPVMPDVAVAVPYAGGYGEPLRPAAQYGYPDYPTGTLRTSVLEFSTFVRCLLAGGALDGTRVLEFESATTFRVGAPEGLAHRMGERRGRPLFGHDGVDLGAGTRVRLDPERSLGVIVLANAAWTAPPERARALDPVERALWDVVDPRER